MPRNLIKLPVGEILCRVTNQPYTPVRGKIVPRNLYTPGRGKIVPRNLTNLNN